MEDFHWSTHFSWSRDQSSPYKLGNAASSRHNLRERCREIYWYQPTRPRTLVMSASSERLMPSENTATVTTASLTASLSSSNPQLAAGSACNQWHAPRHVIGQLRDTNPSLWGVEIYIKNYDRQPNGRAVGIILSIYV